MDHLDKMLRQQQHHIDTYGWAVTAVLPTDEAPGTGFAYTVGLTGHGHPELVIAGLDPVLACVLLNDLAQRVHNGAERFTAGQRISDLLVGHDAVIIEGPATEELHPGTAYARYGRGRVTLQQIVWPDPRGRYPWNPGYAYPPHVQPLLGRP